MSALQDLLDARVADGTVPGAVALLGRDEVGRDEVGRDEVGRDEVAVAGTVAVDGPPMAADAIMRIQSMTKAVTAVSALRLVEAGRLDLDGSLAAWLPELADRPVLADPAGPVDHTVPPQRALTLRHLLTCQSGNGMITTDTPLGRAMTENGTEAGPEPPTLGAEQWLNRLAELPAAFQPGGGWRYHHSFAVLGILLSRVTGGDLQAHLAADLFDPLGMPDTGLWVPQEQAHRLPAAYRHGPDGLVETEPAGGGPYVGPPAFDVAHGELVSTLADFHRFLRALVGGPGLGDLVSADHLRQMTTDQIPAAHKTPDSFFPGFWEEMGWGFGVGVRTDGRYGWAGGQGTDFFVDPDGTIGILLTQVEIGERMWGLLTEFQALAGRG